MPSWRLSNKAAEDLAGIATHTARTYGDSQARRYTRDIRRAIQLSADLPLLARTYTTKHGDVLRRYNVGRHAVFFQEDEAGILIVRILHDAMDTDQHLE